MSGSVSPVLTGSGVLYMIYAWQKAKLQCTLANTWSSPRTWPRDPCLFTLCLWPCGYNVYSSMCNSMSGFVTPRGRCENQRLAVYHGRCFGWQGLRRLCVNNQQSYPISQRLAPTVSLFAPCVLPRYLVFLLYRVRLSQ